MHNEELRYDFTTKVFQYSSSDMGGWTIALLPKEMAIDIRDNFKHLEEGWGRMKVIDYIGKSKWQTSIWFDTKLDTYLLPLKADIRKKEKIVIGEEVKITIIIK